MKTISLNGVFGWEITAQNFKAKIKEDSKEKLRILLNSPGGNPYEAFEMYNIVKAYKGEVEIICGAMVASAASYFAMSVPLENRKGFKNSSAMIHEAQAGARGKAKDLRVLASVMEGVNSILADAYAEGMKGEKIDILKKMDDTHYMTGWEQLVDNNFISDIVDAKDIEIPDDPEAEQSIIMFMSSLEKTPDINNIKAIVDMTCAKVEMSMYDKIAALLKTESTPEEKPVEDNIITEEKMNLQDFLKANPEAKAEYDNDLLSAEEKGRAENVEKDRKRIVNILELSGVKLSENAIKALGEGLDDRDFAVEELKRQKDIRANSDKNIFVSLAAKQTPHEQDPTSGKEVSLEDFDKLIEASAEKNAKLGRLI
jgi:ATP-dependent protease ClpP protease subunit